MPRRLGRFRSVINLLSEKHEFVPLLRSFAIFAPQSTLMVYFLFYQSFVARKYASAKLHMIEFVARLSNGSTASTAASASAFASSSAAASVSSSSSMISYSKVVSLKNQPTKSDGTDLADIAPLVTRRVEISDGEVQVEDLSYIDPSMLQSQTQNAPAIVAKRPFASIRSSSVRTTVDLYGNATAVPVAAPRTR
jgi:hypothetical protein